MARLLVTSPIVGPPSFWLKIEESTTVAAAVLALTMAPFTTEF
jgi:hypothetical protein